MANRGGMVVSQVVDTMASITMQDQAAQLAQVVSQFKLNERLLAAAPVQRAVAQPSRQLVVTGVKASVEEWEKF